MCEFVGERERQREGTRSSSVSTCVRLCVCVSECMCPYLQESILKLEVRKTEVRGEEEPEGEKRMGRKEGLHIDRERERERMSRGGGSFSKVLR